MQELHKSIRNLELELLKSKLKKAIDLKGTMLSACSSQRAEAITQKEIIKILLQQGADINEKDKNGISPLHRAVRFRKPEIVKFLIKKGANINSQDKRSLSTPLHSAVVNSGAPSTKGKNREAHQIIEILLKYGANQSLKNKKGKKPIDYVKKESIKVLFVKDEELNKKASA